MLIAQSENKYFLDLSLLIMINAPLVRDTPGFVLIICKAGRTVSPVECTAPDTKPSANPICTIIVPK